mmetsp:Transcript_50138/g.55948  ORF Transcript_50138/g.55948 Transcript_50138/m.55948 type:complete len:460 (+) Transcript_50138:91-1470(+)|eukprot:CAMPEP_0170910790 /NCGR_PEP_ID=MMETSP0735-20130129/3321_1 /TAXON_ID=186038 /ORGANISM="Fragilariopsis kerguelensis, Strain L26-C5" /LENGTH=459 /DNA_ID=CAMNT_0011307593 /DNA_START=52 /DNA_END=1431 /DNA_ORIENTATION=-
MKLLVSASSFTTRSLWSSASVLLLLATGGAGGVDAETKMMKKPKCEKNVEKFPYGLFNGGYYIQGCHGVTGDIDENSEYRTRGVDARWQADLEYQTGDTVICTGIYCDPVCAAPPGCPTSINVKSCARLRFCYEQDDGEDVWMLPDLASLNACDFSAATKICNKQEGSGSDTCCEYQVEHEDLQENYYFASKKSCQAGLRLRVETADFYDIADQCFYDFGAVTPRVRNCDCRFEKSKPSTLSEPCHSTFSAGCMAAGPGMDADCCADESCVNTIFDINKKEGKKYEKKRQKQCVDWIPGKCDVTGDEVVDTFDCCDNTCSSCGIQQNPFATWQGCDYDVSTGVSQCGTVKKRGDPYFCDFEACPPNSKWYRQGKKYKKWQKYVDKCDTCVTTNMPNIFNNYAGFDQCTEGSEIIPGFSKKYWKEACKAAGKGCKASPGGVKCDKAYLKACTKAKQCPKK